MLRNWLCSWGPRRGHAAGALFLLLLWTSPVEAGWMSGLANRTRVVQIAAFVMVLALIIIWKKFDSRDL